MKERALGTGEVRQQYVLVTGSLDSKPSLAIFWGTAEEDPDTCLVFDLAQRQLLPVPATCCRRVEFWQIQSGFLGSLVVVPDFGQGTVIQEFPPSPVSSLRLRVMRSDRYSTLVGAWRVRVVEPAMGG